MDSYCTCGSPIPVAASFCPNCGRPLRPGVVETDHAPEAPAPEIHAQSAPTGIDAYLRAAFVPALCAMFVRFAVGVAGPLFAILSYLIPGGAGFASVRLFEKRYRCLQSVWEGFGLGALTGLLCFLPSLILQLSVLAVQGKEAILGPLRAQAEQFPMASEMADMLENPLVFAVTVTFGLAVEAVLLLGVAAGGGAVAAKASRSQPN